VVEFLRPPRFFPHLTLLRVVFLYPGHTSDPRRLALLKDILGRLSFFEHRAVLVTSPARHFFPIFPFPAHKTGVSAFYGLRPRELDILLPLPLDQKAQQQGPIDHLLLSISPSRTRPFLDLAGSAALIQYPSPLSSFRPASAKRHFNVPTLRYSPPSTIDAGRRPHQ